VRFVSADEIARVLTYPALIDALAAAFRADIAVPERHHHAIPQAGRAATLLVMPAWTETADAAGERFLGCKLVAIFPDNAARNIPSLSGSYFLMSGTTGTPLAVMDAPSLTAWRTAAASALAARHLAREDAAHLVMVGAGTLAPHLIRAHLAVRPIRRVTLWNRSRSRAIATAFALGAAGIEVEVADDLAAAVAEADIISCATLSTAPLIKGAWLKKGAHVDLVGAFTPKMREADDAAIRRARLYVDTRGALKDAGDLAGPLRRKVIKKESVRGDLAQLCRGKVKGRRRADEITLFKSVGTAIEDLAAAMLVWGGLAAAARI
jgi:ornithine cyclodeaminase/alanine dehydrogenase-like protein (mu-crystallin family)